MKRLFIALCVLGAACAGAPVFSQQAAPPPIHTTGKKDAPPAPPVNFAGVYNLFYEGRGPMTLTLTQNGKEISGSWLPGFPGAPRGTLKGSIAGRILMFTFEDLDTHATGKGGFVLLTNGKVTGDVTVAGKRSKWEGTKR